MFIARFFFGGGHSKLPPHGSARCSVQLGLSKSVPKRVFKAADYQTLASATVAARAFYDATHHLRVEYDTCEWKDWLWRNISNLFGLG